MSWNSLDEIWERSWALLARGVADLRSPFHTPVFITLGRIAPHPRTVVLRRVDPEQRMLICHTDLRSRKVKELRISPMASWLFWDPRQKVQLRLQGLTHLHTHDHLAEEEWQRLSLGSRFNFASSLAPGMPVPDFRDGIDAHHPGPEPDLKASEAWRPHFAAVVTRVQRLEWLWLDENGHRRASFECKSMHQPVGQWLVP